MFRLVGGAVHSWLRTCCCPAYQPCSAQSCFLPSQTASQPAAHPLRRRNPQEAAYNLGRAAHHLGLLHIAVPYYERVLDSAPPPSAAASGVLR